ncbi:TPA: pyridoxal 5'-phosphate synthase lyase subunit PdxS [Candidatus Thalassarchaeaceae archaeon]|jgi:pyridoxal 5'-phosphate synthase pdxS subunit|nr:pyridoxal 5'-phosphate synthase lyase subunit PdxS [Euryarchaeota archaeon]MDG1547455.1 pyridoxal 5'-phosphate synthase lyase subunit PdxS [Candidatus Thalassarchaeaceae archaeon]DAC67903.1 MAG TPA: pyridoxal 5'-phosphate synthase lyase subunit PdxS [Candidatus Poseidoniales archaeon]MBT3847008.1 pyridoxal 5'-phosphate synthase lyase subunit PdxS [Euryarchaeota archaeon]MBT4156212.1 pyridoxal 5'-phosphate synthase lyase subunit PdxS [Euryarchaeota archaeon]|tara:strand:+ start:237 stop:1226 length:990 start_codon:yes stop_codon:yes gene_type:complete
MSDKLDFTNLRHGTSLLKRGFAKMQEGGVIMDVVTPEEAHIAEDAGAVSVMALERVPADIRAQGGVARMSHPDMITEIIETTSIPVMAKARIGHDDEAKILQSLGVDMIDESEVLTPADPFYHIAKNDFTIPFVCGCTNLGEAIRRVAEGAAMIRTKGEAGTGNVVSAVQHARLVKEEISHARKVDENGRIQMVEKIMEGFQRVAKASDFNIKISETPFGDIENLRREVSTILNEVIDLERLPVVTFSAGGIATPADAALMMNHGMDGVFVGSGIFKSSDPKTTAEAIVLATHRYQDADSVAEASRMIGEAMPGLEIETLDVRMEERGW